MDAILKGGIIVNPTQRERAVAEMLAKQQGIITELQTHTGTHIHSEFVGDNAAFLNRFRAPVSMRVRALLTPDDERRKR